MRLLTLGLFAILILATLFLYFTVRQPSEVHPASLVPRDAVFAVTYGSINELRDLYRGGYKPADRDFEPGRDIVGRRINVPELDGIDFTRPVVSYLTPGGEEVILAPVLDARACLDAFDRARESLRLRRPTRIGDYLSFSASTASASRGSDHPRVVRALEYPIGIVLRPTDGPMATLLLALLFKKESGIPEWAASLLATECTDYVVGLRPRVRPDEIATVEIEATPREGGMLARSAELARRTDVAGLARSFPATTLLFFAAAASGGEARRFGFPLDAGDMAIAVGINGPQRPCDLLLAIRPLDPLKLRLLDNAGPSLFWPAPGTPPPFVVMEDNGTAVRTAPLAAMPPGLEGLLHPDSQEAPHLFLSTASEGGVWYVAVGPRAENTVRTALACARGAGSASLLANKPAVHQQNFFAAGHVALGMLSEPGMKCLGASLPLLEIGGIGPFATASFVLDVEGEARLDLRLGN